MTLRKLLGNIDFDYEVTDNDFVDVENDTCGKVIKLIDNTGANLGHIENERYNISDHLASTLIDRLEIYWSDYFNDEEWVKKYGYDRNDSYEEMLEKTPVSESNLVELLRNLANPETIVVEL